MKRSTINALIREAKAFMAQRQFALPPFAFWTPADWRLKGPEVAEIVENGLGWDITDFGSGDYEHAGLLLFTIRNGHPSNWETMTGKLYAEKIMIVGEGQVTPFHFHWNKMEDIINRGGGDLVIQLYNATDDDQLADTPVTVSIDGVRRTVEAGGFVRLTPGESISLPTRLYHSFWGAGERGRRLRRVLVGEVSLVNDDAADNRFLESLGRFPEIEEDAAPLHLLVTDYARFYGAAGSSR
jgi:D-lyxose ketol-isomerase